MDRAIDAIRDEDLEHQHLAYFALDSHNIYLKPDDSQLQPTHPRNRKGAGTHLAFHNSSLATLMIQRPERGGAFKYVKDVCNADNGEMNFDLTEQVLNGETPQRPLP